MFIKLRTSNVHQTRDEAMFIKRYHQVMRRKMRQRGHISLTVKVGAARLCPLRYKNRFGRPFTYVHVNTLHLGEGKTVNTLLGIVQYYD